MPKKDYGEVTGICSLCGINLWSIADDKPVIWPCNITTCPYEDPDKQHKIAIDQVFSATGSGLGQI